MRSAGSSVVAELPVWLLVLALLMPGMLGLQVPRSLATASPDWSEVQYYYESSQQQQQQPRPAASSLHVSLAQVSQHATTDQFSEVPIMVSPVSRAADPDATNPMIRLRKTSARPVADFESRLSALETALQAHQMPAGAGYPQQQQQPPPPPPAFVPPVQQQPQPPPPQQQPLNPQPVPQPPVFGQPAQAMGVPQLPVAQPPVQQQPAAQSPPAAAAAANPGSDSSGESSSDDWAFTLPVWGFGLLCLGSCVAGIVLAYMCKN